MPAVRFWHPLNHGRVGPVHLNEPAAHPRGSGDPEKSYTQVLFETEDVPQDAEVTVMFRHEEPGATLEPFTKRTSDGSLRQVSTQGATVKYRTFFQFVTKAAGVWTIEVIARRDGEVVATATARVRVVTTVWPFFKLSGGLEIDVDRPHGETVHGYTYFRPINNAVAPGHTIPNPDRNRIGDAPSVLKHDALDVVTNLRRSGRSPFSGTISMKRLLIPGNLTLGHYIRIDGKVVTTSGAVVRYRACIAHLNVTLDQGDKVIVGQLLGRQSTPRILHFGLINLDDQQGPHRPGGILGDEAKMPGGGRSAFLQLDDAERRQVQYWRSASSYYESLRMNMRAALLQDRFGYS